MGLGSSRNAPCPCGSGKKYKKCCYKRHREIEIGRSIPDHQPGDLISLVHKDILIEHHSEIEKNKDVPYQALEDDLFDKASRVGILSANGSEYICDVTTGTSLLVVHMNEIEKWIETLSSRHSKLFWLQISRRLFPYKPETMSSWTRLISWLNFVLSLYKYGEINIDDMSYNKNIDLDGNAALGYSFGPKKIDYEDILALYQIEILAIAHNAAASILRRLWKGGSISFGTNHEIQVLTSPHIEKLIEIHDRRVNEYSSRSQLTYYAPDNVRGIENPYATLVYPILNVDSRNGYFYDYEKSIFEQIELPTNYMIMPLSVLDLYEQSLPFDDLFQSDFGISIPELFSLACSLSAMDLLRSSGRHDKQYRMMQRAYCCYDKASLLDMLWPYFITTFKSITHETYGGEKARLLLLIDFITQADDEYASIDLWTRSRFKPIHKLGDLIYVDYLLLGFYLFKYSTLALASKDGRTGSLKGKEYEACVGKIIEEELGIKTLFTSKRLKTGIHEFEVDIGFVVENFLLLGECKARIHNTDLEKGVPTAIRNRWESILDDLQSIDEKAEIIADQPVGLNYEIPSTVDSIIPFSCYPNVEYIPTLDSEYWLDEETPRACTPLEVCKIAKSDMSLLSVRHFVKAVTK